MLLLLCFLLLRKPVVSSIIQSPECRGYDIDRAIEAERSVGCLCFFEAFAAFGGSVIWSELDLILSVRF